MLAATKTPMTPAPTASTTASEKVTPDPKHIRTGEGGELPEPRQLFVSPEPEAPTAPTLPDVSSGGGVMLT